MKLEQFVMVMFLQDTMVQPKESEVGVSLEVCHWGGVTESVLICWVYTVVVHTHAKCVRVTMSYEMLIGYKI